MAAANENALKRLKGMRTPTKSLWAPYQCVCVCVSHLHPVYRKWSLLLHCRLPHKRGEMTIFVDPAERLTL